MPKSSRPIGYRYLGDFNGRRTSRTGLARVRKFPQIARMKGNEEKRKTETRRCCVNRRGKGKGEGKGERLDSGTARTCTYTEKKQKRLADLALTSLSLPWHGAPHRSRCPFETDATESFILPSKTTEQSCSASSTERRSCSWPFQLLTMLPPSSTEKLRFTDPFFRNRTPSNRVEFSFVRCTRSIVCSLFARTEKDDTFEFTRYATAAKDRRFIRKDVWKWNARCNRGGWSKGRSLGGKKT